tara:strand:+ start:42567 stop:43757 length:1191 start_codon:yes stop_codon:yes gene_type:complete
MAERLLIVGASARAAAESAKRARFNPLAIDQFGDRDLRRIADVRVCERFPEEVPKLADGLPSCGLVLTGAMENHLSIVQAVAAKRPYWGCPLDAISAVRDPIRLQQTLQQNGLPYVATRSAASMDTATGRWLKKPLKGSSGVGICMVSAEALQDTHDACYFQRIVDGTSQSGVFLATDASATLIGVTEQWIGVPWLNARPFGYAGSLGPLPLDENCRRTWQRIGEVLGQCFGLRGIFGVDAVVKHGAIHVIEINPRFPASAEILDLAGDGRLMQYHVQACTGSDFQMASNPDTSNHKLYHAKVIYFAPEDLIVSQDLESIMDDTPRSCTSLRVADIPATGTTIRKGHPVFTLLAQHPSVDSIQRDIRRAVDRLRKFLVCCVIGTSTRRLPESPHAR